MRPSRRMPLNKRRSSKKFNRSTSRVKAANAPMRGGYRF